MALTTLPDTQIDRFVERQSGLLQDSFSHDRAWLDLLTRLYGYTLFPLTTTNASGQISGFLPLCLVQSPLTGRRLVALPFSDCCPLLAEDEASTHALVDQAINLAQQQKAQYLELRTGVNDVLTQRADLVAGHLYVRWLKPLAAEPDAVWSGLRKPIQHQIKKAQKLGVQVRSASRREDIEHYYRLHLQTRSKKQGMPAQSRQFFYGLWDTFGSQEKMLLLLAEYEERVIAGMILLSSGSTVRYAYGASDESFLSLAPNNLLLWTAITWGCSHGYHTLDLGRTATDNQGLMEFKRRWGAVQEPLTYYYHPQMAGLASTSEHSWKFRLLTACWKRLPLQVSGPLGGYFYKHLG
jgi:FemAB-related protein (PEP-CTERM system-associated)